MYARLRGVGPAAVVEIAPGVSAMLVTSYGLALRVLRDPESFPRDPRGWQASLPSGCPVLPMLGFRPNALFSDGLAHARLRAALADGLGQIDPRWLREVVERSALALIEEVAGCGEADLVAGFAARLPVMVFTELLGCPAGLATEFMTHLPLIFDATGDRAGAADRVLTRCWSDLVELKQDSPGEDLPSWLLAHPAGLSSEEVVQQLVLLVAAGVEPTRNLIANAVRVLLSEPRFADGLLGGSVSVDDAITEVLWADPPMANYTPTHPADDIEIDGVHLAAGSLVLVSLTAANNDPALGGVDRAGNQAHLAWGAGPHLCPARAQARLIAAIAIDTLLDHLPGLELAVAVEDLTWRPGPFHRALTTLPVRFPPTSIPTPTAGELTCPITRLPAGRTDSTPQAATSTARRRFSAARVSQRWWSSLARWWHGR
ncbi:cytochrome P450 [Actinoalloteichus sp. GBA129-24]|nr:cytochrome P450 [Actinoalloteichus sp. GBA129-24]